jgi:hypothetical protein
MVNVGLTSQHRPKEVSFLGLIHYAAAPATLNTLHRRPPMQKAVALAIRNASSRRRWLKLGECPRRGRIHGAISRPTRPVDPMIP